MGRHPEPTRLKVLKGVANSRINSGEPIPSDQQIVCPDWVPELGKQLWSELAPDLIAKKVLTSWDIPLFATLCEQWHLYRRAVEQLHRGGQVVAGHRGVQSKSPYAQVARDHLDRVISMSARFGLSPSDRARLSIEEPRRVPDGWDLLTPPLEPA